MRRQVERIFAVIGESSWVLFGFFFVAAIVFGELINVIPGVENFFSTSLGELFAGGLIYTLVVIVVILPVLVRRRWPYVRQLLGLRRFSLRKSIGWALSAWLLYMLVTIIVAALSRNLPWIDHTQQQDVGFQDISQPLEYVFAFFALVILPPIAEELLFRGYLFGRLRERFGFVFTTLFVSIVFGFVHLQWNVGIDVAILSIFLCYLREKSGSIWPSVLLHAFKNGIAYFLLFIAPLMGINIV